MIQTNSQSPQASECLERLLQAPASVKNLEQLLVLYQSPGILLPPDKKRLTEKLTARILSLEEEADEIDLLLVKAVQSFQIGGKTKKARQVQRQIKDKSQSLLARMEISNSLPLQEKLQEISQTLDLATNLESPVEKAELLLKMLDISPRHILLEKTLKILREIQKLSHNLELEDRQRVAQNLMEYCLDQPWLHQAIEQAPFLRKFLEPREKDVSISLSLDLGLIFHQLGNPSKSRKWLRKTLKGIWKAFPSSEGLLTFRDLIEEHQHQQLRIPKGLLKELAKQLASRMHSNDSQNEKFCEELEEIKSSESTNTLEPLLEVCR